MLRRVYFFMYREESKSVGAYVMTNRNVKREREKNRQQHDARKMLVTLKINTRVAFNYRLLHMCMLLLSFFADMWNTNGEYMVLLCVAYILENIRTLWRYVCVFFHSFSLQSQSWYYLNFYFVSFMFCLLFFLLVAVAVAVASFVVANALSICVCFFSSTHEPERSTGEKKNTNGFYLVVHFDWIL